jgi:hypothetical protein
MGISGCVLRTHGCRSFLPFKELPFGRYGAALHCGQHLSVACVAMDDAVFSDRCSLSGFNPDWKPRRRPSNRATLFQPHNALYDWLWRYRAAQWRSPDTRGTRRGYRSSLHSDYSGAVGRQVQKRAFGLGAKRREGEVSPSRQDSVHG